MLEPSFLRDPNPFGSLSDEVLEKFEAEVGRRLPQEFRDYLLLYNGAKFSKTKLPLPKSDFDCVGIHHIYGLHSGPSYNSMWDNWQLWRTYDLQRWRYRLGRFIVFADTATGDLLAVDSKNGSVWLYEHDIERRLFFRLPGRLSKISDGFNDFFKLLLSEEEHDENLKKQPEYEEFQLRRRQMQKLREDWVKEHKAKSGDPTPD